MTYYVIADSFGAELPRNWKEIADFLNDLIDERDIAEDHNACNELWEQYWYGEIEGAPEDKDPMDADMMFLMVADWITDHDDPDDPLVLDGSPYYDSYLRQWTQDAHDSEHTYTLVADADGNIQIVS